MKTDSQIIDSIGGTTATAVLCGLSRQAVSNWRARGIPKAWREAIKGKRPDLFKAEKPRKKRSKREG